MYQNIALSPLFFDGLRDLSDLNFSILLGTLLTERILSDIDKNILKEYDRKLKALDNSGQITPLKKAIIETLTLNGIIKLQEQVHTKERNEKDFNKYESERVLALNDECKLIITDKTSEKIKLKFKMEADVEIADIDEYSIPPDYSRIRALETIKKEPGQIFNFRGWVLKYIKDAKKLILKDGYICIGPALSDLKFILKHINKDIQIEIHTLSDSARNWPRQPGDPKFDNINVREILERIKKDFSLSNFNLHFIESKKRLTERNLETDIWRINVGHAFGSVESEVARRQFEIIVQKIK